MIEAALILLSALQLFDGQGCVICLAVHREVALADSSLGGIEIVAALAVFVTIFVTL
ncbi:hypothetical protein GCM10010094_74660 [Streptomyces flaveus]|uniref:Uncharacterized protein n=1 Tax=Streptomyces flaveus TaxID=66370 RepID=A0A917VPY6_9ACTN|nr:hypothetical protein GCM10010094_74660 [Streptomyces flaveus]